MLAGGHRTCKSKGVKAKLVTNKDSTDNYVQYANCRNPTPDTRRVCKSPMKGPESDPASSRAQDLKNIYVFIFVY